MLVLDTCALIYDALSPSSLSRKAEKAITKGDEEGLLACSDISFWEIAMLISKGRLDPGTDAVSFLRLLNSARQIRVIPISPEIAAASASSALFVHGDPADRIIAATAIVHKAELVTCDGHLSAVKGLRVIW
jgi:PIN domain nuclease of toxin-antitoxin system